MPRDADNPRADKVAVVEEVRGRFDASTAALLTEYRGLNVVAMADLRRALRSVGGDYKIYKNTLVRFAARDLGLELDEMLVGPTAIAFVEGDPVNVAKALRDFARTNPALIVKGGLLGETVLDADGAKALAEVEPREVLLAKLAGAMAAPMVQFAGLLQALPRNLAYGIQALIDQKGGAPEPAPEAAPEPEAAADETPAEAPEAVAAETPSEAPEAPADETPVAEAADETQES
jgi:large subunit ribosomal protein L10